MSSKFERPPAYKLLADDDTAAHPSRPTPYFVTSPPPSVVDGDGVEANALPRSIGWAPITPPPPMPHQAASNARRVDSGGAATTRAANSAFTPFHAAPPPPPPSSYRYMPPSQQPPLQPMPQPSMQQPSPLQPPIQRPPPLQRPSATAYRYALPRSSVAHQVVPPPPSAAVHRVEPPPPYSAIAASSAPYYQPTPVSRLHNCSVILFNSRCPSMPMHRQFQCQRRRHLASVLRLVLLDRVVRIVAVAAAAPAIAIAKMTRHVDQ